MAKKMLVVGSTNAFDKMIERGIRVGHKILSENQSKRLVKVAIKQLPVQQAREAEAHLFAGYIREPISVAVICSLTSILQAIVADPVQLNAVLA